MKVFVACPGITGTRTEAELDTSRRIDGMYYRGPANMTPVAYCYRIEARAEVEAAFDEMLREEEDLRNRHYKRVIELREKFGV